MRCLSELRAATSTSDERPAAGNGPINVGLNLELA